MNTADLANFWLERNKYEDKEYEASIHYDKNMKLPDHYQTPYGNKIKKAVFDSLSNAVYINKRKEK